MCMDFQSTGNVVWIMHSDTDFTNTMLCTNTACICINDSYYASWDLQLVIPQPLPRIQCKLRSQLLLIRFVLYRLSTRTYNSTLMHRTSNNCGNMVLIIGSPVDHRSMVMRESQQFVAATICADATM